MEELVATQPPRSCAMPRSPWPGERVFYCTRRSRSLAFCVIANRSPTLSEELENAPGPETLSGQLPRRAVMRVIARVGELVGWRLPVVHGMALVYAVSHGYALLEQPTPLAASEP